MLYILLFCLAHSVLMGAMEAQLFSAKVVSERIVRKISQKNRNFPGHPEVDLLCYLCGECLLPQDRESYKGVMNPIKSEGSRQGLEQKMTLLGPAQSLQESIFELYKKLPSCALRLNREVFLEMQQEFLDICSAIKKDPNLSVETVQGFTKQIFRYYAQAIFEAHGMAFGEGSIDLALAAVEGTAPVLIDAEHIPITSINKKESEFFMLTQQDLLHKTSMFLDILLSSDYLATSTKFPHSLWWLVSVIPAFFDNSRKGNRPLIQEQYAGRFEFGEAASYLTMSDLGTEREIQQELQRVSERLKRTEAVQDLLPQRGEIWRKYYEHMIQNYRPVSRMVWAKKTDKTQSQNDRNALITSPIRAALLWEIYGMSDIVDAHLTKMITAQDVDKESCESEFLSCLMQLVLWEKRMDDLSKVLLTRELSFDKRHQLHSFRGESDPLVSYAKMLLLKRLAGGRKGFATIDKAFELSSREKDEEGMNVILSLYANSIHNLHNKYSPEYQDVHSLLHGLSARYANRGLEKAFPHKTLQRNVMVDDCIKGLDEAFAAMETAQIKEVLKEFWMHILRRSRNGETKLVNDCKSAELQSIVMSLSEIVVNESITAAEQEILTGVDNMEDWGEYRKILRDLLLDPLTEEQKQFLWRYAKGRFKEIDFNRQDDTQTEKRVAGENQKKAGAEVLAVPVSCIKTQTL